MRPSTLRSYFCSLQLHFHLQFEKARVSDFGLVDYQACHAKFDITVVPQDAN